MRVPGTIAIVLETAVVAVVLAFTRVFGGMGSALYREEARSLAYSRHRCLGRRIVGSFARAALDAMQDPAKAARRIRHPVIGLHSLVVATMTGSRARAIVGPDLGGTAARQVVADAAFVGYWTLTVLLMRFIWALLLAWGDRCGPMAGGDADPG